MTTTTTNGNTDHRLDARLADPGRKALHAYVSDEAHDSWHEAAAEHGVSVSAILEALAPIVDRLMVDEPYLARNARKVDAARRRRNRRS
jgi:hypothetical protein